MGELASFGPTVLRILSSDRAFLCSARIGSMRVRRSVPTVFLFRGPMGLLVPFRVFIGLFLSMLPRSITSVWGRRERGASGHNVSLSKRRGNVVNTVHRCQYDGRRGAISSCIVREWFCRQVMVTRRGARARVTEGKRRNSCSSCLRPILIVRGMRGVLRNDGAGQCGCNVSSTIRPLIRVIILT